MVPSVARDTRQFEGSPVAGRLAQLGERRVRNAEVEGSSPLPSTTLRRVCLPRKVGMKEAKVSRKFRRIVGPHPTGPTRPAGLPAVKRLPRLVPSLDITHLQEVCA